MLKDENRQLVVQALHKIQEHFNFDGWLVNIENNVDNEETIDQLKDFLTSLRRNQTKIIWYDSITSKGSLDWQNKLCPANKCFYDLADGIFLNYWFSKSGLEESYKLADPNFSKVYASIDCFAPRTPANRLKNWPLGGFEIEKVEKMIFENDHGKISRAVFAPGWLFENYLKKEDLKKDQENMPRLNPEEVYQLCLKFWSQFGSQLQKEDINYKCSTYKSLDEIMPKYDILPSNAIKLNKVSIGDCNFIQLDYSEDLCCLFQFEFENGLILTTSKRLVPDL